MADVASRDWKTDEARYLVDVIVGVPSEDAARFLAAHIQDSDWEGDRLVRQYEHLARFIPAPDLGNVIATARQRNSEDIDYQYVALRGIQQGIARRGADESAGVRSWGTTLAAQLLNKYPAGGDEKPKEALEKQRFAADLVGKYKIRSLEPTLVALVESNTGDTEVRTSALRSLLLLDKEKHAVLAGRILKEEAPLPLKNRVATMLGDFSGPAINKVLAEVKDAPPDLQSAVVMSLAGTAEGKNIIFRKVKNGELFPRTLVQPKVEERILLNISPSQRQEYEAITAKLEPLSKERQVLIDTRVVGYNPIRRKELSIDSGRMVFKENCSACHAIGGEGGAIGPQLDGVGKWGTRALAEKILDPNRNVSEAFRTYTITTKDGKVLSGLLRREEGEVIVFADITGKEFSVPKNEIAEQKPSRYTLMPDHFSETLPPEKFYALLKYLLSLQS